MKKFLKYRWILFYNFLSRTFNWGDLYVFPEEVFVWSKRILKEEEIKELYGIQPSNLRLKVGQEIRARIQYPFI